MLQKETVVSDRHGWLRWFSLLALLTGLSACASDSPAALQTTEQSEDASAQGRVKDAATSTGTSPGNASTGASTGTNKPSGVSTGKSDAGAGEASTPGTNTTPAGSTADAGSSGDGGVAAAETPTVACNPADKKPDPKNFAAADIERYKGMTLAKPTGPYGALIETDPAMPESTIYRPAMLGAIKHPILVWANGACSKDGTYFSKWLLELVSHGFVVVSDGTPNGSGSRDLGTNGDPQIKMLDWIIAENERPCSQYYHKLDVTKTAASGQSCGGLMTLGASGDKRLTTVLIFNSGMFSPDDKIYGGLHAPMAYIIGGMDDIAYPQAETDVKAINTVPLFYGNLPVGHFATWADDNAGEFGRIGVGWLKWQLMGDPASEKMFAGADCELCQPPSKWTVVKKMMQ